MIFNRFEHIAKKYPNNPALNDWSYEELLDIVIGGSYQELSISEDEFIIIDILRAAYHNSPLIIPPKFNQENIDIPSTEKVFSLYLYSSGSTGKRKSIKLTEKMIYSNFQNAVNSQDISKDDKILTVCSTNHTGGINAQSLPGLLTGSHVIVKKFNPYGFSKLLKENNITLTHLIPVMIDSLLNIKSFDTNQNLRLVVAGSDCVNRQHVNLFLEKNIPFMINYGLTEAGPIIINRKFTDSKELDIFDNGIIMGDTIWCDYKIENNELLLKGDCVSSEDWLSTGDCVDKRKEWFIYNGRISAGCKIVPKHY